MRNSEVKGDESKKGGISYCVTTEAAGSTNAAIAVDTKRIAKIIVAINNTFSKPRRVLQVEIESPPPKAPPAPASDR